MYENFAKDDFIKVIQEKRINSSYKPRKLDFDKDFVMACEKIFGSWSNALKESEYKHSYTREDIYNITKNYIIKNKEYPTIKKMSSMYDGYEKAVFLHYREFTILLKLLEKDKDILKMFDNYKDDIKSRIKQLISSNKENFSFIHVGKEFNLTRASLLKLFGYENWIELLNKELGYSIDVIYNNTLIKDTKEELIIQYLELCKKLGRTANYTDLRNNNKTYNGKIYMRLFGSMKELKIQAGVDEYLEPNFKYTIRTIETELKFQYMLNDFNSLSNREINKIDLLPNHRTIVNHFKVRSMREVWENIKMQVQEELKLLFNKNIKIRRKALKEFVTKYQENHTPEEIAKCLKLSKSHMNYLK